MRPTIGYENTLRRMFPDCSVTRYGKPIVLPYNSRNPLAIRQRILDSLYLLGCGNEVYELILFIAKGIRDKAIACKGSKITVRFKPIRASDYLSGLSLRLQVPSLCIDACCIDFSWKKSRFKLDADMLTRCKQCISITF